MSNHDWFPKINYYMSEGMGYGVPMFYGQYFLYIPAILVVFFKTSMVQGWLCLYVVFYSISLFTLFLTGKKIGMTDSRSIAFSMIVLFNPLIATIIKGNLPYAISLVLTPLLLVYIHELFEHNPFAFLPIAVIAAIIINTHILSTMIILILSILFILFNYKRITINVIIDLFKSLFLTILLSFSFIMPFLEQNMSQQFRSSETYAAFRLESVQGLGQILTHSLNDGQLSISLYPSISLVGLILFVGLLLRKTKAYSKSTYCS